MHDVRLCRNVRWRAVALEELLPRYAQPTAVSTRSAEVEKNTSRECGRKLERLVAETCVLSSQNASPFLGECGSSDAVLTAEGRNESEHTPILNAIMFSWMRTTDALDFARIATVV